MEHLVTSIGVVLPVFLIIGLGYFLKRRQVIDERYIKISMKVVFNIALPGLLFSKVSKSDMKAVATRDSLEFALFVVIGVLVIFVLAKILASILRLDDSASGTFVQGIFRSNYVIIGYSVIYSLFGDLMVTRMAILVLTIVPLYNILAIWVLSGKGQHHFTKNIQVLFGKVIRNPLIIGILLGFIVAIFKIPVAKVIDSTVSMIGAIGTPLGLLGIGAYFSFDGLSDLKESLIAVLLKILVFPILVTGIAFMMGFPYMDIIIIFVLFGSPTAITSFIMATAMDGNSKMAANIVIISTVLSLFTLVAGISFISNIMGV